MSDGVQIGSGTFATILGVITILNPRSNKSDANLEDSACKVSKSVIIILNPQCSSLPVSAGGHNY